MKINKFCSVLFVILFCSIPSLKAQDAVMMQGFYWDVVPGGTWYDSLSFYASKLGQAGFTSIWFPPAQKGDNGGYDVGYTPYDYYDLGEFDSRGGDQTSGNGSYIATRYGTKSKLIQAVQAYHNAGISVIADMVLNHRSGGSLEPNPFSSYISNDKNGNTWTKFPLTHGSGRIAFNNGVEYFYPNTSVNKDNTSDFYGPQYNDYQFYTNSFAYDNALHYNNGAKMPFGDSLEAWGDWLTKTVGFDGYRFDFVKGIHPAYLRHWCNYGAMNGKFYVGEFYDGDIGKLKGWLYYMSGGTMSGAVNTPGTTKTPSVFDFNMRFAYKALSDGGNNYDIRNWNTSGLMNNNVDYRSIVMFVENHDFDRNNYLGVPGLSDHNPLVNQKLLCYAHMLMSPGTATVFWRDYFYYGMQDQIAQLVNIRRKYASGIHHILTSFTDGSGSKQAPNWPGNSSDDPKHVFVMQRMGDSPSNGLILAINKHTSYNISVWVTSQQWKGKQLYDVTGNVTDRPTVSSDGRVLISTKANSYSIFVPIDFSGDIPTTTGHFPTNTLGYKNGTQPHPYTVNPNMRQTSSSLGSANSTIYTGDAADLYLLFKFDTSNKNVFLVYTTNGTAPTKNNGTVINAAFSQYSEPNRWWYVSIPGTANVAGTTVKYLFYISDNNGTLANANQRVAGESGTGSQYQTTWDEGNNYFSYEVMQTSTGTGGNWNVGSTWVGGVVPAANSLVEIKSGATVNLTGDATIKSVTINSGSSLNCGANNLNISNGGSIINKGTFSTGSGTVNFVGAATVTGNVTYNNINVSGVVALGTNTIINGFLRINNGGSVTGSSGTSNPVYGTNASLIYNSGSTVNPSYEWAVGVNNGAGVPNNVQVSTTGTILNLSGAQPRTITGNLTIDAGTSFYLSGSSGADLYLGGNLINNGIFSTNYRELTLNGTANQTITSATSATTTLDYVQINNSSNVTLNSNLTINSRIRFTSGCLQTGSNTLMLANGAAVEGEASGKYIKGNLSIAKTVSTAAEQFGGIGVALNAGTDNLGTVTVLRKSGSSGAITINSSTGINRSWVITAASQPVNGRTVSFSWVADDDNGKNLSTAQLWKSSDGVTNWQQIGTTTDASSTRTISGTVNSFSTFTVSDGAHPLPVELAEFKGKVYNKKVHLNWVTITEVKNYGFDIERKLSDEESSVNKWEKVGFIQGCGTSNIQHEYSFTDETAKYGKLKYRLKQIDNDGASKYSGEVEVMLGIPNGFILEQNYPNPFNPATKIRFALSVSEKCSLKVFNTLGKEVCTLFDEIVEEGKVYDVEFKPDNLSSGIYFYRLTSRSFTSNRKMVFVK